MAMRQSFETTVAIMREMSTSPSHWNVRRSYSDVAKKLGIDEETVRNRIRSLKESGFLLGWRLIINARVFGKMSSIVVLELKSEKHNVAIGEVSKIDGIVLIQSFYGKSLQLVVFSDNERQLREQIKAITSVSHGKILTHWNVKLPRCTHEPKQMDWLILGSLLKDADKRIPEIADGLRVSAKTVKRRINLMVNSSAFFIQPVLDLNKVAGALPCQLLFISSERKKSAIDNFIMSSFERIVFCLTDSPTHSIFNIICSNLAEAKSIEQRVRNQVGVSLARIEIIEGLTYVYDWMAKEITTRASGHI